MDAPVNTQPATCRRVTSGGWLELDVDVPSRLVVPLRGVQLPPLGSSRDIAYLAFLRSVVSLPMRVSLVPSLEGTGGPENFSVEVSLRSGSGIWWSLNDAVIERGLADPRPLLSCAPSNLERLGDETESGPRPREPEL